MTLILKLFLINSVSFGVQIDSRQKNFFFFVSHFSQSKKNTSAASSRLWLRHRRRLGAIQVRWIRSSSPKQTACSVPQAIKTVWLWQQNYFMEQQCWEECFEIAYSKAVFNLLYKRSLFLFAEAFASIYTLPNGQISFCPPRKASSRPSFQFFPIMETSKDLRLDVLYFS